MFPADGLTGESIGSLCSLFLYDMIGGFPTMMLVFHRKPTRKENIIDTITFHTAPPV